MDEKHVKEHHDSHGHGHGHGHGHHKPEGLFL